MSLIERIKEWYRGPYVPPAPNDPNSPMVFLSLGHHEQPPLAKLLGVICRFYLAHWQWIIGTLIAVFAIVAAN